MRVSTPTTAAHRAPRPAAVRIWHLLRERDRWRPLFVTTPQRPVTARAVVATAATVVGGAAVSIWRNPGASALDTTVMEDANLFLADAVDRGFLPTLFAPYSGYLHLVPRIFAGIASLFPVTAAAAVMAIGAALFTSALAVVVYTASGGLLRNRVQRLLVSAPVLVMPVAQVELFNEINMLRWQLMYATFWAVLWVPQRRAARWTGAGVLVLAGLSDNIVFLFIPLLLLRIWVLRDRAERSWRSLDLPSLVGLVALGVGTLSSVVAVVSHTSTRGVEPRLDPVWALGAFVVRPLPQMLVGTRWVTETPEHTVSGLLPVAIGWLLAIGIIVVALRRLTCPDWLLAAVAAGHATVLYLYTIMVVGVAGPRYSAPAAMLLLTALVALLRPLPASEPGTYPPSRAGLVRPRSVGDLRDLVDRGGLRLAGPLLAFTLIFSIVCVTNLRLPTWRSDGPLWSAEVDRARAECLADGRTHADLRVSPLFMGWVAHLPCAYLLR